MAGLNGRVRRFPPGFFFWAGSGEHELGHALDHRVRAARLKVSGRVAVRIQVALEHGLQPIGKFPLDLYSSGQNPSCAGTWSSTT